MTTQSELIERILKIRKQSIVQWVDGAGDSNSGAIWWLNGQMCGAQVSRLDSDWWIIVVDAVRSIYVHTSSYVVSKRPWC